MRQPDQRPGHGHWHAHDRWRGRHPATGSLRRDPEDRLLGGVAAAIARWRCFNVTTVRIGFVLLSLFTGGMGIAVYTGAWLFMPTSAGDGTGGPSIWAKARSDSRGIALAAGLAALTAVVLLITGVLNVGWFGGWGWPQLLSVAALTLIWRNAPPEEQATLRRMAEPLGAATASATGNKWSVGRIVVALGLMIGGGGWLASDHIEIGLLRPLGAMLLMIAGVVILLGPWWLRIARDLAVERQARVRAQERIEIASRIHDSVLQTLALIQRRAEDPQKVIQLARAQERELRSWLFDPASVAGDLTFAGGVRQIQQDVEERYGVQVEAVTVGDCPVDSDLEALLAAAREATVNAAKWSGATVISVFAEVEPSAVAVVVRDRGKGFDPEAVSGDHHGIAESIHGRMARHRGTAAVVSATGEGTKVTLTVSRS